MSFFGLMTVREHDRIIAKADAVIDDAAQHVAAEEFRHGRTLGQKVAIAIKRLEEARSNAFRNRQIVLTKEARIDELKAEIEALRAKEDRRKAQACANLKQNRVKEPA